ncbi:MAG: filamentous hemagglutinin N-terminal domain-containing protein [Piscinibacter sp.]|nr:filamentous hemagglutinin N-terminal domain-containing protein [Piscinibacter sp.]
MTVARRSPRALPRRHPIGLAALLALAGPAWALPQGATVVNGQVTIATPSPTQQVITQGSARGIVDWNSFSIAAGEQVRFDQPSSSAVLLNRVTGQDPSQIFGQLQSNGRIFLLNPYGVVFGASARVDVGGMVASSLSLSNADFLAGRFALTSDDPSAPAQRGAVRNAGAINAPGGLVVLAGPQVENTGSIDAAQGRVGLAAAQQVLVDVEGDGLIFFQTSATEAGNRLAQLGRIQADAGSVELRAAARGGFADTVLNMGGAVQARSLGLREGRVVIDGGDAGITRVAGTVDVSGGDHGGRAEVTGEKVLLDAGSLLDASGGSAGGTVLVGGNWQGQGPLRNAQQTHVDAAARIDVSATGSGDAGTAVVWADDTTRFYGHIDARGGASGGDGGQVEVSGKRHLTYAGDVDARATAGRQGALLLDPSNIRITDTDLAISPAAPFVGSADTSQLSVTTLRNAVNAANVTVDANGGTGGASTPGISVEAALDWNSGFTLTLQASGTIDIGANISNAGTGGLNLFTDGAVTGTGAIDLSGGAFTVAGTAGAGSRAASYSGGTIDTSAAARAGGAVNIATLGTISTGAITTRGGAVAAAGAGHAGGALTLDATNGSISTGTIDLSGSNAGTGGSLGGGSAGDLTVNVGAGSAATVTLGTVTGIGGTGSINSTGNAAGGIGGAGSTIVLNNLAGNVTAATIDVRGGTGGVGSGSGADGSGGAAGDVSLGGSGALQGADITATGGATGGGGGSPVAGSRGDITLAAGTNLTLTGALNAGTGSGASAIALNFGQAGGGGVLDLTAAGALSASTLSATGGASATGDIVRATRDVATITLGANSLQFAGSAAITLSAVDAADLTGGAGANSIVATAWGGMLTVHASGGGDSVQGNGAGTTFVGSDTGTTYTITTANTGSGGGTTLTGVGRITGGAGDDSFVFGASGSLVGITGGGGANTLDLAAKAGAVAIDLGAGTATDAGTFTGITAVVGNDGTTGANTTLTGPGGTQTFAVTGTNAGSVAGVAFSGVGNLTGGSGPNTFTIGSGGSLVGSVTGSGADTLDLSARSGAVAIDLAAGTATGTGGFSGVTTLVGNDGTTGTNTTLTGGNGGQAFNIGSTNAGTIDGSIAFSGVGNLAGGSAANTFVFGGSGGLTGNLAGGAAGDTLDLSARGGALTVNLQTGQASGIGGTFSGITTLAGNQGVTAGSTTLIGSDAGLAFTLTGAGTGTAGGLGFSGITSLTGGSGADSFTGTGSLVGSLADGGGATSLGGTLTTGSSQTFDGAVTLTADTTLASSGGGTLRFNSTVNGNQALALSTTGTIGFGAAVGAGTPLASLSASAGTRLERAGTLALDTPATLSVGGVALDATLRDYFTGGAASALRVDAGAGGVHDVTADGASVLPTLAVSGSFTVNAGGAITQSGALSVAGSTQVNGGANAITLSNAGNQLQGTVGLSNSGANDVVLTNDRATQLGTVSVGSGALSITAAGALTQLGALTQSAGAGAVTLAAGSNPITLTQAGNDFVGAVALTGAAVQLNDQNALALAASTVDSLVVTSNGAITQTGDLNVTGTSSFGAGNGSITLQAAGNSFGGSVALSNSGANAVALHDSGALLLSGVSVGSGMLQLSAGGAITQSATVTQAGAGAVTLDASANAVTLGAAGNDFQGAVSVIGTDVTLADQNALTLAGATLSSLSVSTNGAILQSGALSITGISSFSSGSGAITLLGANSFGGAVTLASAGNVALNAAGALQVGGATLGTGSLTLTSGGAVTQSGAIVQASGAGAVSVNAGANAITLDQAGNDFTGAVSLANSGANDVVLRDANALTLGTLTLGSGTLSLTSTGDLTQTGALTQAPGGQAVTIAAGGGNVVLDQAGNDFRGAVDVSGASIALRDADDLTLSALTPTTNGSVSLVAGGQLTLPSNNVDTGTGDLTLSFATLGGTLGTLHGRNVSLSGSAGMALGNVSADGTLALASTNAAITQQLGTTITASGATTVNAGSGDVVLANTGNDFASIAVTGGAVSLRDLNALNITALNSGANRSVSLVAGGALTTPAGAINTGSADLTLSSGAAITTPGSLSGNNLSLTGAAGLAIGSSLSATGTLTLQTTNAAITQSGGSIAVTGTTSVNAGSGNVSLAQAGNDFGGSVSVTGGAVSLRDSNALTLGALQTGSLDVATVNGAVTQTAAADVSGSTLIDAGTAAVTLTQAANRFASVSVRGGAVSLRDADALELGAVDAASLNVTTAGAITQSAPLRVGGASVLNAGGGDITLAEATNDFGTLSLSGGALSIVDANDLTITSLSAGANRAVSLIAGGTLTLPVGDIDTGTASLTLVSNGGQLATRGAVAGQSVGLAGATGIVLGGNVVSATDQVYATGVTLAADATLDAGSGRVSLLAGLSGAGNALSVAGDATLAGAATGTTSQTWNGRLTLAGSALLDSGAGIVTLARGVDTGANSLAVASPTLLGGDVTGTGPQAFGAGVTLTNDVRLDAGAAQIALLGGVDGGSHRLDLASTSAAADAIRTGAALQNLSTLNIDGRSTLGGVVTSTGAQRYAGSVTLAADATLDAGTATIALLGGVDGGGHGLGLASTGAAADTIRIAGSVVNAASLSVDGRLALGGGVSTSGAQDYRAAVRLDTDAALSGASVAFAGPVDGAHVLNVTSADTRFAGAVGAGTALTSLTVGGAGSTRIGADIRTTGTQTYGNAVRLDADVTLAGSTLRFDGSIDGAQALTLQGSAATTIFNAAVGAATPLAALTVSGPTVLAGGLVATTGGQRYDGAVTLGADTLLSGSTLTVNGTLDGARSLDLQFSGTSTLAGAVGGTTALTGLDSDGNVVLQAGSVTTSGAQRYGGTLQLAGDTALHAGAITLSGAVSGARDLLLEADTLAAAGPIAGTGTLRIAPRSIDRSIGVAGGAGDLQISQALIDGAAGFANHVFGRGDGTGDVNVGDWRLVTGTTLQSGSGELHLAGSVDGAFDLALNTGGVTRIAGPVGTTTALRSLSTDNAAGAPDWDGSSGEHTRLEGADARVVTTGAQTYADPLVAQGAVQFVGSAITAEQLASRFGGPVSANAVSLVLRSADDIALGTLTLSGGGRVETDGVLHLTGALQLDGGTLSLVSNATPSAQGFTDPDLQTGDPLTFGFTPLREASGTIVQEDGATLSSAAGSLLVLRSPNSGSILLDKAGNTLLGEISAVSGPLGDNSAARFAGNLLVLGFVRLSSSEIHVAGAPPAEGAPDPLRAGIEGDVLKLSADQLTTGTDGLLRARLPFLESQGSQTSLPALTLVMSPQALALGGGFGTPTPDGFIRVRVGSEVGGYLTVRPKGAGGENALILLAGPDPKPFYDGSGKLSEVRVFYNGDAPRTPQETGALTAVTAIVEDARQTRFEEAVRTENVKSRLRSGVIAEVGSGRPATVGRESIRLPQNCAVKPDSLQCE